MDDRLADLLAGRTGHFAFESGHHGNLWLDLEKLCLQPRKIEPLAAALAAELGSVSAGAKEPVVVCGPLVEGAFVAMAVARHLGAPFTYSTPKETAGAAGALYPIDYPIPRALHSTLHDAPVVIVNDVINAGSAVRGTIRSLRALGARPVAIATLATLGALPGKLAAEEDLPLVTLSELEIEIYEPARCPWCAVGVSLDS